MEVKIKNNNELIEADWTVEDGVMVVSPKEVKFKPKDGDIVSSFDGKQVFINKDYKACGVGYAYLGWNFDNDTKFDKGVWKYSRYATEEEKQKLFQAIADEGLEWDVEKRQFVKMKWKPKYKEFYFRIIFEHAVIIPHRTYWTDDICDKAFYQKGWCFKTKEECQEFCDRLNKALEKIKP